MSEKTDKDIAAMVWNALLFPSLIGISGFFAGISAGMSSMRNEAVARGVAGYDEQTGEWKWTVERKVAGE